MENNKVQTELPRKRKIAWILAIFGAAFLLRLLYLIDFSTTPLATHLILDPRLYNDLAKEILGGNLLAGEVFFKAPLYPYFLAAIYAVFGTSLFVARFIQLILGSFTCVLVYLLAQRFYSNKIAVTAGFIAAAYGPLIMFDAEILIPSLIIFLDLISIYLLFKYEDSGKLWQLALSALVLGLSSLARPNILVLLPGILFWLIRYSKQARKRWKRDTLVYIGGVALMLMVLVGRNYAASDKLILFGNYGGYNFLIGNNAQSDGRTAVLPGASPEIKQGYEDAVVIANHLSGRVLSEGELGWFWFRLGLEFVTKNPGKWLWLEVKKLVYLTSGFEIPNNRHIYYFANNSPVLKFLLWDKLISFPFGVLLPFALVAAIAGIIKREQFILTFFVVAYALTILVFFVTGRFRLPLTPVLIIWGAAGFWYLLERYRRADYQRFYRLLLWLIVFLIPVNGLTHLSAFTTRPPNQYESHLVMGDAYHAAGENAKAEKELMTAARLNPRSARVFNSLGNVLAAEQKDSLAIAAYKRGVAVDPNYITIKKSLASIYKKDNRFGDLYKFINDELDRDSTQVWAIKDYAYIHVILQKPELAIDLYEKAFDLDSTDYEALFEKAQTYLDNDMRKDAEREYLRLLKYLPNSVQAHANLGQTYARQGRYDDALREFQWVQENDSLNPSSYFNLASLYYQMGKLDRARQLVSRIDQMAPDFPSQGLKNLIERREQELKDSSSAGATP
jgi:tetratricopeptide (TPR) repeat protein